MPMLHWEKYNYDDSKVSEPDSMWSTTAKILWKKKKLTWIPTISPAPQTVRIMNKPFLMVVAKINYRKNSYFPNGIDV